ncbi:MAG: selenocysteine-specific translation elongation factor [Defluviitaleaceae bacterium]|nr:selenocysteine-specific translation elongation factor [Defluviitaleaceae bacterium]
MNNNVIIGTAGHVDHGKTSLIKALTGIDTDRLKEEKKRGITIELGFAYLDFGDGMKVGIVDVPGHEKFVKNMLAGAGGIDIAILVVAANEGVMPQTIEHFGILKLLNIKKGVIVITKTDMVDDAWLAMIKEDVSKLVLGSTLEGAAVLETSVHNNKGLDELKAHLYDLVKDASSDGLESPARLPVDRVFSIDGFGTVVTGTLIEGVLNKGDSLEIYPYGHMSKVRNIQVHDEDADTAYAGQRVAINLAGVRKDMIERGAVVAQPKSMVNTYMLDVFLQVLPECGRTVKNNSRVHLYHGTRDILCKIILLDKDELSPGEAGFAQLRLEEEGAFKYGDRFIVRFYSPLETIGGGMILDVKPRKHSRYKKDELVKNLGLIKDGSIKERIYAILSDRARQMPQISQMAVLANVGGSDIEKALDKLSGEGKIVCFESNDSKWITTMLHYKSICDKSNTILQNFHKNNAYKKGMNIEEYKNKAFAGVVDYALNPLIDIMIKDKKIKSEQLLISAYEFKIKTDNVYNELSAKIEKVYKDAGVLVPNKDDVLKIFNDKNKQKVMESMISEGILVMVDKQLLFHKDIFEDCIGKIKDFISQNGEITLAQYRDMIGASRKYAVAILEYCDTKKITKKIGDSRVLYR